MWGWYTARLPIGFVVGISTWPPRWYLRGPLCGLLMPFRRASCRSRPPGCEGARMFRNDTAAVLIGTAVAGLAWLVTGREHA